MQDDCGHTRKCKINFQNICNIFIIITERRGMKIKTRSNRERERERGKNINEKMYVFSLLFGK